MGFYGNITNTNKTQFTFDRTYSSRALMENRIKRDEIYLGRYVLVEYDADNSVTLDTFVKAYKNGNNFYTSPNFEQRTRLKMGDQQSDDGTIVTLNQVIYIEKDVTPSNGQNDLINIFYKCDGNGEDGYAIFTEIAAGDSNYVTNYNIDKSVYGNNRGYDSTVWQKIYVNDKERFIMIAELNTRTPSFDLVVDAPTMVPITPHFGANSTNMDYKLHWQPQWGLRVGKPGEKKPSDANIVYYTSEYVPETDEIIYKDYNNNEIDASKINQSIGPGAIYFNKAALSSQIHKPNENVTLARHVEGDNYFTILPVSSGKEYNIHDGTLFDTANDTYEMRVNLPAIGNMVSNGWDALIGEDRLGNFTTDTNSISWLKNNLEDQILALQALISGGIKDGLVMTDNSGNVFPGYLNGQSEPPAANTTWNPSNNDRIFAKDSWIYAAFSNEYETVKVTIPVVDENSVIQKDDDGNIIMEEKEIQVGGLNLYHNFTPVDDISSRKDISVSNNSFALDIPIVDATGHVVGYNVTTFNLPKLNDSIMCTGSWLTKTVDKTTNIVTISHKENTIETVNYSDQIENFQVIATGGTQENHVTKVINVKKDDFSLYWKGLTD